MISENIIHTSRPWYESWFNSKYYHILYQNRNEKEAEIFLDNLLSWLKPAPDASMLDLGCGRGRHALYLSAEGYTVTGIDLSFESIRHCLRFENDRLSFFIHDMRKLFRVNDFDIVFNLFTSLGYFESSRENGVAIANACSALKKRGHLVIDYLNTPYSKTHLVKSQEITAGNICFNIRRWFDGIFFIKEIRFHDQGQDYEFEERVAGLNLEDFKNFLEPCNMKIVKLAGDYDLESYEEATSPRLIIIAEKQ